MSKHLAAVQSPRTRCLENAAKTQRRLFGTAFGIDWSAIEPRPGKGKHRAADEPVEAVMGVEDFTDYLNARFGDPALSRLDRMDGVR